jgi:hypothetical protein
MGVVFVACAKWPVTLTEVVRRAPIDATFIPARPEILIAGTRPPTFTEWAIRASIASAILLAVFVLTGAWRARNAIESSLPHK